MKRVSLILAFILFLINMPRHATGDDADQPKQSSPATIEAADNSQILFDDTMLLDGYAKRFKGLPSEIILEMIKDESLNAYKVSAAVRVFREQYANAVVSREKNNIEKILLRCLNRTDSIFVQVEIFYTLTFLDRYKYFEWTVPLLIQKLEHYNSAVNDIAFEGLSQIINMENNKRAREARIVFNTLRKMLFLSRNRLAHVSVPDQKLTQKLQLLRWSIKVLGNQELKKLPKEIIPLL